MPSIDVISLDSYGYFHRVRGVSTAFNPVAPTVPYNELQVAEYYQNWNSVDKPQVENNGVKVVSVREQRQMKKAIAELYGLSLLSAWNVTSALANRPPSTACLLIRYWMATSATLASAKTP